MAFGALVADSGSLVTYKIGGTSLLDLAHGLFGADPPLWGRYFSSIANPHWAEYIHTKEDAALAARNIHVLAFAQQTDRTMGSFQDGVDDATANAEDFIATFGAAYLAAQGGSFLLILDVEDHTGLGADYYRGWSTTLSTASAAKSNGSVTLVAGLYASQDDNVTWNALATALAAPAAAGAAPAQCYGVWVARYYYPDGAPRDFDANLNLIMPAAGLPAGVKLLAWQYMENYPKPDGIDGSQINPNINLRTDLVSLCVLPP